MKSFKKVLSGMLATAMLAGLNATAMSQTITWTGALSDDFITTGNWDSGTIPGKDDAADLYVDGTAATQPVITCDLRTGWDRDGDGVIEGGVAYTTGDQSGGDKDEMCTVHVTGAGAVLTIGDGGLMYSDEYGTYISNGGTINATGDRGGSELYSERKMFWVGSEASSTTSTLNISSTGYVRVKEGSTFPMYVGYAPSSEHSYEQGGAGGPGVVNVAGRLRVGAVEIETATTGSYISLTGSGYIEQDGIVKSTGLAVDQAYCEAQISSGAIVSGDDGYIPVVTEAGGVFTISLDVVPVEMSGFAIE